MKVIFHDVNNDMYRSLRLWLGPDLRGSTFDLGAFVGSVEISRVIQNIRDFPNRQPDDCGDASAGVEALILRHYRVYG